MNDDGIQQAYNQLARGWAYPPEVVVAAYLVRRGITLEQAHEHFTGSGVRRGYFACSTSARVVGGRKKVVELPLDEVQLSTVYDHIRSFLRDGTTLSHPSRGVFIALQDVPEE